MPKGSPELTNACREEITSACEELYKTKGFKDVTIRDTGKDTEHIETTSGVIRLLVVHKAF